jgi:D-alanyl-D-alanine carboxypeptidase (penicillin-binding protein 5/6)
MDSTTKIMTATIVLENCDLNSTVEVSKNAAGTSGSRLGLSAGDKITVKDLLYGLMLCSGNDAAVALAEATAGSVTEFANLMNEKAQLLNLTNTHFVTPHGLDSDEHYTTAYELATLANYAMKNETFAKIVSTTNYTVTINGHSKTLNNTNELLGYLDGVYGIKTGFTNGANRCLVTACRRGEMDIICVVLGADTKKFRTQDSIKLIEYTFKNFEYVNIDSLVSNQFNDFISQNSDSFIINKGTNNIVQLNYNALEYSTLPIPKEKTDKIEILFEINYYLNAPISSNSHIGNIYVLLDNNPILNTEIIITNCIKRKNTYNYLLDFFKNYNSILKKNAN